MSSFHRPTVALVSLSAVRDNIKAIREKIGQDCRVMAVVKADAYGHGMIPVAKSALEAGAAWLGIATVDEAVSLRESGFRAPVLLLGPSFPEDAETLVSHDISVALGAFDVARALGKAGLKLHKKALVHLKVDTGMGRFGFWWKDLASRLSDLKKIRGIHLQGCFTHFAVSDIADFSYTRWQISNFRQFLAAAQKEKVSFDIVHAANSGAILQHPDSWFDLVRAGVMIYGMLPDKETTPSISIKPVMTLKTKLVQIHERPKGRFLSYGCAFQTRRKSRIGILPIGYGDGFSRRLSNRGEVIIRGCRAPIVGRVCMDQVLVDVTDIPAASIGDDVLLWGQNGNDTLKVEEVASWMDTITYEVTCALGKRVPRIYMNA
ncbi:alanine racemase [Candidatus Sumerlaeota bacterium]|nr:alanine racemase [Candidatus Sumerlaeota bacterium]